MEDNKIQLSELIQHLKEELMEAQRQNEKSNLKLVLDSAQIELSVAVSKTGTGKGGIKFWVVEAGAEYQKENALTHKFTLALKPNNAGDIVVNTVGGRNMSND